MRRNCFNCGKELIIGHDIYFQVDIIIKEIITHHNIWRGKTEDSHATFCEDCGVGKVNLLFDELQKTFRTVRLQNVMGQDSLAINHKRR